MRIIFHFYFGILPRIYNMTHTHNIELEIEDLYNELHVVIPEEIQEALECGDLRENSEMSSILDRQHIISIRLSQLLHRLHQNKKINIDSIPRNVVGIGSLVKVQCVNTGTEKTFKIIHSDISDDFQTDYEEVTINSLIGKGLYNKTINDTINIRTPKNIVLYKIINLITIHDLP